MDLFHAAAERLLTADLEQTAFAVQLQESLERVRALGLDQSRGLSVLDLGAGAGFFAFLCRQFGHHVTAVHSESPDLEPAATALEVRRTIMRIEPQWPLPNFDRKFDVITASELTCHHAELQNGGHPSWNSWSCEDWLYLFHDIINRQLKYPGRIHLDLTKNRRRSKAVSSALAFLARHGAKISGTTVDWRLGEPLSLGAFSLPDTRREGEAVPVAIQEPAVPPPPVLRHAADASVAERLRDVEAQLAKGAPPPWATTWDRFEGSMLSLPFKHLRGLTWFAELPLQLHSEEPNKRAALTLLEDDRPLSPSTASTSRITESGAGAHAFLKRHVHFSTSDGSDPNENGRVYAIGQQRSIDYLTEFKSLIESVPHHKFLDVYEKHRDAYKKSSPGSFLKYVDLVFFGWDKYYLTRTLGLHKAPPMSILDIGCGPCHFDFVCRSLGHRVTSIDVEQPIFDDIAAVLGSRRTIIRVEPTAPLPNFDRKFDLVVATDVQFHDYFCGEDRYYCWSLEDWIYLLDHLINRQLCFPGRIFLRLNTNVRSGERSRNTEVLEYCAARGAKIQHSSIDWKLQGPVRLR
jgi:SAM-dependent methyltransferase